LAIDAAILVGLFVVAFAPFWVLAVAYEMTQIYRRRVSRGEFDPAAQHIPALVRLYGASVRTVRASLIVNLGGTAFFFGVPLLAVWVLWPEAFVETFQALQFWIVFWIAIGLVRVCLYSPDSTGGLRQGPRAEKPPEHSGSSS